MGLMDGVLSVIFGGGRNVIADTAEVFRENAEKGAGRASEIQTQAMVQFGHEFSGPDKGGFDRFMDGVNRVPRPAMALGTLGLFVAAMVDPLWFAARMQGIALVPEPLWWLLGVIVSFYFGARHQLKQQSFQRDIAQSIARAPQVVANIKEIERLRTSLTPGAAGSDDAEVSLAISGDLPVTGNRAINDWRRVSKEARNV